MPEAETAGGVLLLGGSGFVGRHLMLRLRQAGRPVFIISRKAHTLPELDGVQLLSDSLDNVSLLNQVLPHCTTVFHLASTSTPGTSAMQPAFEASNNLLPTLRFLETLQQHAGVDLVFLSSGGAIYGNLATDTVREDSGLNPASYYGAGKAALEKFIIAYCTQLNRAAVILRPANFYGPWQPYRSGFGVVPTIFNHLIAGTPFEVWGDGENVRDYLYIDDFIDLCLELTSRRKLSGEVPIYNVGSQKGVTLNALCDLAAKIAGKPLERIYRKSRAVDVRRVVLDCSAAQREFGWSAKTGLEQGLASTWSWLKAKV